ncbi:MAG: deoxyribonuclease IV [Candidatus Firestonebacteria bacterium]
MNIGFHASTAGGLVNAPLEAVKIGCKTFQVFSKSPQKWAAADLTPESITLFKNAVKTYNLCPVVVHTGYLINLASPNEELYRKSIDSFSNEIVRAEAIGADYISTHIGSCGDCDKKEALGRIKKGVKEAVSLSESVKIKILFENSAKIKSPGGEFKDLAFLAKTCGERYGLTLDTCHAFAAGYDFRRYEILDNCLKEVERIAGSDKVKVVHLNDSKGEFGSGIDRHEHLGRGNLGREGICNIINHPLIVKLAFILETPKEPEGSDASNVKYARPCSVM